jgi:hypothetical protein
MTRCNVCWAGLGLWLHLYHDTEHADALADMTVDLATVAAHSLSVATLPRWHNRSAQLLDQAHEMAHGIVKRYTPLLLERATIAYQKAHEAGELLRAGVLQLDIDALNFAVANARP